MEEIVAVANDTVQSKKAPKVTRLPESFEAFYGPFIEEVFGIQTLVRKEVYKSFFEQFGAFIVHLIAKRNKVTRNSPEIVQELFTQLQEAHVIEKFFDQARDSVPETITTVQAFKLCGVKWDAFRFALWTHRVGVPVHEMEGQVTRFRQTGGRPDVTRKKTAWMPSPISGSVQSLKAVYRTEDIIKLSEMGYFKKVGVKETPYPKPTRKYFQHYLASSVNNRFKNFCRGEERHHQERVWDTFAELRPAVDDPTPWENRLPDLGACNQEARAELSLLIRDIEASPAGAVKDDLFNLLGDGYDLDIAIDKLTLTSDEKRATKLRVSHWIKQIQARKEHNRTTRKTVAVVEQEEELVIVHAMA